MSEWRPYRGEGRPVPNGTSIEIKQRDGKIREGTHWSAATWQLDAGFPDEDVAFWRLVNVEGTTRTLLDDFAIAALTGFCSTWTNTRSAEIQQEAARQAYAFARAMLTAREGK